MSFRRLNLIFTLVILALAAGFFWYYRHTHPKYIPPTPKPEINVTIIPGWNLRQIADDWVKKGLIKNSDEFYARLGQPAFNYVAAEKSAPVLSFISSSTDLVELFSDKPDGVSYEGYLFPDTYRVYADAEPEDILKKIFVNLENKISPEMRETARERGMNIHQLLTLASIVEKEAPSGADMGKVADIFWRRLKKNWALQSCATVNYITGKKDRAVTAEDKEIDSLFNTYKYPGLPPGPISNPSLAAIQAALSPEENDFWFFMSDNDGATHYARTLEEHNANVRKYLR